MATTTKEREQTVHLTIPAPKFERARFTIIGTAPLVMCAFSEKARETIKRNHEEGSTAKNRKKREPRDFAADCEAALHRMEDGRIGFPASAFRASMIDACRVAGFKMTLAKLSVFVEADGIDKVSGQPLVHIVGEYEQHVAAVRNQTGVTDLRSRPMFRTWQTDLRIVWDGDQFKQQDVANLLSRAGLQCGIGEGRPNSRESFGLGWGTFEIASA